MESTGFSRLIVRFAMLLLLGSCFALWPLAGYAATLFVTSAENGVDEVAQAGLAATKSASVTEAAAGTTITYAYRITNTGTVTLTTITAVDDRLGAVGLAGPLVPSATVSAILTYTVQASDPAGPLTNMVTVTGTAGVDSVVVVTASVEVLITDPTALPEAEQPNQPLGELFLPFIQP